MVYYRLTNRLLGEVGREKWRGDWGMVRVMVGPGVGGVMGCHSWVLVFTGGIYSDYDTEQYMQ